MLILFYTMLIGVAWMQTTCSSSSYTTGHATGVIRLEGEFELTAAHEFGHK